MLGRISLNTVQDYPEFNDRRTFGLVDASTHLFFDAKDIDQQAESLKSNERMRNHDQVRTASKSITFHSDVVCMRATSAAEGLGSEISKSCQQIWIVETPEPH